MRTLRYFAFAFLVLCVVLVLSACFESGSSSNNTTTPSTVSQSSKQELIYCYYDNGTCSVAGIKECSDSNLIIPKYASTGQLVVSIERDAFSGCSSLVSVSIPDSIARIDDDAFEGCTSLESVYYEGTLSQWCSIFFLDSEANPLFYAHNLYINGSLITDLVIPDDVTTIGGYAFCGCSGLTSVTIGAGVTRIGAHAFHDCPALTSIVWNAIDCVSVHDQWLDRWSKLSSVTIGDSVVALPAYVFYACPALTEISIPDSVLRIGEYAFRECSLLNTVHLGSNVADIARGAFYGCEGVCSVTIPNSVSIIGDDAFSGCIKLIEVCNLSSLDLSVGSPNYERVKLSAKHIYSSTEASFLFESDGFLFYDDGNAEIELIAYYGTDTAIILPSRVNGKSYGVFHHAFRNNESITSVDIAENTATA